MTEPRTLKEQQKRYLQLNGDPVHMSECKGFLTRPQTKASALISAFAAAAILPQGVAAAAATFAAGMIGHTAVELFVHGHTKLKLSRAFKGAAETICIDTAPDSKTAPTSPEHHQGNRLMRNTFLIDLGIGAACTPIYASGIYRIGQFITGNADTVSYADLGWTCFILSYIIQNLKGYYQHSQIEREKWVITDMPKKIEQEEKSYTPVPLGLLGTFASFMAVHSGAAALRHHRIFKREWVVTDLPKPLEQRQDNPVVTPGFNPGT